jgi:hypothetical protein
MASLRRHRAESSHRHQAFDHASRTTISDMSTILMNSFIFEMIYCKRRPKNAPKAMADSGDICTNHRRRVTLTLLRHDQEDSAVYRYGCWLHDTGHRIPLLHRSERSLS